MLHLNLFGLPNSKLNWANNMGDFVWTFPKLFETFRNVFRGWRKQVQFIVDRKIERDVKNVCTRICQDGEVFFDQSVSDRHFFEQFHAITLLGCVAIDVCFKLFI